MLRMGLRDDTPGTNLATNILANPYYYAAGELNQAQLLGKYSTTRTYSNRDWYTGQSITNTAGLDSWSSSASYDHAGRVTGTHDTYGGNWTYGYDSLNRLSTASGPSGAVSYTIDGFGNKSAQTVTSGSGPSGNYGPVAANNRLTGNGVTYDAAGNVLYDGFHTYTYDGEGRLYSVDGNTCYAYDGEGDRVATTNCNVTNRPNGTTSGITAEFLYDPNHNLMTEINVGNEQMQRANIYAGGWFVAEDSPDPFLTNSSVATQFRITDQVGSLRGLSDLGNPKGYWSGAWSSFPYGDGATVGDGADSQDQPGGMLFTGKKRDTETGLDYFGARYYSSTQGRFMSPDPSGLYYADITNPQSMNLYSYALNNPLINTDPTGMECVWDDGSFDSADDTDTGSGEKCGAQGGTWIDPDLFENGLLTNGQNANYQRGDWSGQANSTIASSWTDPSSTTNGGSTADIPLKGDFSFDNLTATQFIQQMTLYGVPLSKWDTAHNKLHNGTQLRSAKQYCGLHVTIDPGSGQDGKPVTGNFHLDLYNPVSISDTSQMNPVLFVLHGAFDVVPDELQDNGLPWFPTGNQQCLHQ